MSLGYSRLKARQRLTSWVDLLALAAGRPDENWTAHAVGRGRAGPTRALTGPLDDRANELLRDLVALYDLGLRQPVPAPLQTACAWAEAHARELRGDDRSPADAAAREWVTDPNNSYGITGEDADASHVRVYGDARTARGTARCRARDVRLADLGATAHRSRAAGATVIEP